jgi:hypothetical protein
MPPWERKRRPGKVQARAISPRLSCGSVATHPANRLPKRMGTRSRGSYLTTKSIKNTKRHNKRLRAKRAFHFFVLFVVQFFPLRLRASAWTIVREIRAGFDQIESSGVIPAEAGIQQETHVARPWMPASAGMTIFGSTRPESALEILNGSGGMVPPATGGIVRSASLPVRRSGRATVPGRAEFALPGTFCRRPYLLPNALMPLGVPLPVGPSYPTSPVQR